MWKVGGTFQFSGVWGYGVSGRFTQRVLADSDSTQSV